MSELHAALLAQAETLLPDAVLLRREIHRHPELGNQLPQTRATVLQALQPLDLDVRLSQSTSGIVAVLEGSAPGPSILLRGDMDALPMPEDTGLEFASEVDGRMHACGHDSHTAMLATAARLLSTRRAELPGKVIFMFQPGEESPGGAQPMIDEGLFDADARPDAAFALHIYPNLHSGVIACRAGAFLAAADKVSVEIRGKGGHGSMPYDANDPVPVICELVQAFQTFVTRRVKPFDPVVLTVGRIAAGTVNNVIPERAMLEATLRSFSATTRDTAKTGIRRLAEQLAAAYEMQAEVTIDEGYPATYNDADFVEFVRQTTVELFGEDAYQEMPEPLMGAEDFSLMLQRTPGAMVFLGVAPDGVDPAAAAPCHSNRMQLNESAMAQGVALHAAIACEFLRKHG
jgi:hippurate hydrolase